MDRASVLIELYAGRERLRAALASLPDAAMLDRVDVEWTRKDVLAHLGAWERRFVDLLRAAPARGVAGGRVRDRRAQRAALPRRARHLARGRAARGGGGLEPVPRGGRGHDRRGALRRAPLRLDAGRPAGRLGHRQRQRACRRAPRPADAAGPGPERRLVPTRRRASADAARYPRRMRMASGRDAARGHPRRGLRGAGRHSVRRQHHGRPAPRGCRLGRRGRDHRRSRRRRERRRPRRDRPDRAARRTTVAARPKPSGPCSRPAPTSTSRTTGSTTRSSTPARRACSTSCDSSTRPAPIRRSRTASAARRSSRPASEGTSRSSATCSTRPTSTSTMSIAWAGRRCSRPSSSATAARITSRSSISSSRTARTWTWPTRMASDRSPSPGTAVRPRSPGPSRPPAPAPDGSLRRGGRGVRCVRASARRAARARSRTPRAGSRAPVRPRPATGGERPEDRPTDEHAPRAEREAIATSRPRRTPPSTQSSVLWRGRRDLLEDVDRGRRPIELAPAVVRDDDRVDAVLGGEPSVLAGHDALEDERQPRPRADRRERLPRQVASRATRRRSRRRARVVAVARGSHASGQGRRPRSCRAGRRARTRIGGRDRGSRAPAGRPSGRSRRNRRPPPARRGFGSARVDLGVELEQAGRVRGRRRDLLDRRRRHRRGDERDPGGRRRAGGRQLRVGVGEAVGRHRGDRDGHGRRTCRGTSSTGRCARRRRGPAGGAENSSHAASFSARLTSSHEPPSM